MVGICFLCHGIILIMSLILAKEITLAASCVCVSIIINLIETGDGWGTHVQLLTKQLVTSSDYWDGGRVLKIL